MIISHKFKFIFIKTQKSAGTSIEVSLANVCGKDDIVTPYPKYSVEGFQPRNYEGFRQHMSASQIKERIPIETWNNYFKFTFERNPFDKMVSWYWDRKWHEKFQKNFCEFCVECSQGLRKFPKGYELYTIDDKVVVDFIGKYESLKKDFEYVCNKLDVHLSPSLPQLRSEYKEDDRHYSDFYNSETRKIVETIFRKELEMFSYSFDIKN